GAEALPGDLAEQLLVRSAAVWNLYGPTETTIWSTLARVRDADINIGRPIANTECFILDPHQQMVPAGITGQLYIGGEGLARGYWNRPELTAERFVPNPFSSKPGARMYTTGDVTRYQRGGEIEVLGRVDHQVKIRGHRIELGEIEAAINH